ncbi:MAG: DsbA family protein [Parvularcula sp.]
MPLPTPLHLGAAGGILLLGTLGLNAVQKSDAGEAPPQSRAEIEEIIHDYILNNPEVIFEAADRYSEKMAAEQAARSETEARANFATLASASTGFALGAELKDADVVIVEFFDYNCGICRRAADYVFDLKQADPGVRLVLQELPVVHQDSRALALATMAAPDADSYAKLHLALMHNSGVANEATLPKIARRAGVNFAPYLETLKNDDAKKAFEAKIDASVDIAYALGMDGTPGFVIASADGSTIRVFHGFDEAGISRAVDEIRNGQL